MPGPASSCAPSSPASSATPAGCLRSWAGRDRCASARRTSCAWSGAPGPRRGSRCCSPGAMDNRPPAGEANPVARLFDHVLHERRQAHFPAGVSVLDLGREPRDGSFGAAFAGPEAARRLGAQEVGRRLREGLAAGAPVVLAFPGARPLPALLEKILRGAGDPAGPERGLLGRRDLRQALGAGLEWRRTSALGVLLPGTSEADWAAAHPQAFGLLAVAEEVVRAWPLLRAWGALTVLEGVRR